MGIDLSSDRVAELEQRVLILESRLQTLAAIVAAFQPVGRLMAIYGVPEQEQQHVYLIVDEMSARADSGVRPSFAEFEERIVHVAGACADRRFIELLVEALKVERPDKEGLFEHFTRAMALVRA